MGEPNSTGYSAAVRIWLEIRSQIVPLSHASATYVIAKDAIDLLPGEASIVFTVDDERYERSVELVNGMSKDSRKALVLGNELFLPF